MHAVVFHCCAVNCVSTSTDEEKKTVFSFPKGEHFQDMGKSSKHKNMVTDYTYIKHFEEKY